MNNRHNDFMTFNSCSSDVSDYKWEILNLKSEIIINASVQGQRKITEEIDASVGIGFFSRELGERRSIIDGHPGNGISMVFLLCGNNGY